MGRALGAQYRRSYAESAISIIGLDYFFITKGVTQKMSHLGDEFPENEAGDDSSRPRHCSMAAPPHLPAPEHDREGCRRHGRVW